MTELAIRFDVDTEKCLRVGANNLMKLAKEFDVHFTFFVSMGRSISVKESLRSLGSNVSDDIVENTEDTMTLLEKYVDELDVTLDKTRLKNTMRTLYNEAQDLEL